MRCFFCTYKKFEESNCIKCHSLSVAKINGGRIYSTFGVDKTPWNLQCVNVWITFSIPICKRISKTMFMTFGILVYSPNCRKIYYQVYPKKKMNVMLLKAIAFISYRPFKGIPFFCYPVITGFWLYIEEI
jgi:hypothetical protein